MGDAVTPSARLADTLAVEEGEVVVSLLVEVDHLPSRVLAAAAWAHGQLWLLGAKPGARVH